jgi:hypothetical protein
MIGAPRLLPSHRGVDATTSALYPIPITIWCASYPEWLRERPDDATATGSPTRRMLVLTPAQRWEKRLAVPLIKIGGSARQSNNADGTDKITLGD